MATLTIAPVVRPILTVGGVTVRAFDGDSIFFFKAGMAIDADGSPTAYHPVHGRGLDNLANAGHDGNWYGVVTDTGRKTGKPIIQGSNDPGPGFYVSPTALQDHHLPRTDPRRYVDSSRIPYISLPGHHQGVLRASLGDLAMVINTHNGKRAAAIVADTGPRAKIGEGSIALANSLGLSANARHGGTSAHSIIYVVFPRSGQGQPLPASTIQARGSHLFEAWGGLKKVAACFPESGPWPR